MENVNQKTIKAKQDLESLAFNFEKSRQEILDTLDKDQRLELGEITRGIDKLDRFKANGHQYVIRTSLAISRFEEFEKVQAQVGYGVDFRDMFANMNKAYAYLNDSEPANASVVLYNMMNGVKLKLEERENEVLQLCALFISRENEDVSIFDPEITKQKIQDWRVEGIEMESFFHLAFSLVNGFIPIYNQVSESISDHMEKVKKVSPKRPKR